MGGPMAPECVAIMAITIKYKLLKQQKKKAKAKCYLFKKNVHTIFVTQFYICIIVYGE